MTGGTKYPEGGYRPSERRREAPGGIPDWGQVFAEAEAIEKEAPGTVCLSEIHYLRDHRHPIPYRMGYCHYHRQPNEHYHRTLAELERCEA